MFCSEHIHSYDISDVAAVIHHDVPLGDSNADGTDRDDERKEDN